MIRPSLLTFTLSLLTACGGGGSDSDGIPTTPPSAADLHAIGASAQTASAAITQTREARSEV